MSYTLIFARLGKSASESRENGDRDWWPLPETSLRSVQFLWLFLFSWVFLAVFDICLFDERLPRLFSDFRGNGLNLRELSRHCRFGSNVAAVFPFFRFFFLPFLSSLKGKKGKTIFLFTGIYHKLHLLYHNPTLLKEYRISKRKNTHFF